MLKGMIKRMKQKNYKLSIRKSIILMSMAFMVAVIGFIGLMVFPAGIPRPKDHPSHSRRSQRTSL